MRGETLWSLTGTLPDIGQSGFADEVFGLKRLQVVAGAEAEGEASGYANRVLHEGGVLVGVGMRDGRAEVLDVVARHLVRIGAQRSASDRSA